MVEYSGPAHPEQCDRRARCEVYISLKRSCQPIREPQKSQKQKGIQFHILGADSSALHPLPPKDKFAGSDVRERLASRDGFKTCCFFVISPSHNLCNCHPLLVRTDFTKQLFKNSDRPKEPILKEVRLLLQSKFWKVGSQVSCHRRRQSRALSRPIP